MRGRRSRGGAALPPHGAGDEALAYYLRDIHATPVLTAAQEVELARAMRAAREGLRAALAHVPGARKRLVCAWREREAKSLVPELLSERYEPGADTGRVMLTHEGEEGGVVISGRMELTVGEERRILGPGDAYYFESRRPHRFRCVGPVPCEVISACTPPTF